MKNLTRKIALSAAALLAVGTLAACGTATDTDTDTAQPRSTNAVEQAAPIPLTGTGLAATNNRPDESNFLGFLVGTEFSGTPRSMQLDLGYATCDALDAGIAVQELVNISFDNGYSIDDTSSLIVGAAGYLCPENLPIVEAYAAS